MEDWIMKKVFTLIGVLLMFAACNQDINEQPAAFDAQVPEEFTVSFTIGRSDAFAEGPQTRATIKSDWGEGDMVFVFFKGIAAPKYMMLYYNGWDKVWEANYMNDLTAADLANAADKKMTAIYMPYGKFFTVMAQGGNFVFPVGAYNGIFYMAQQVPYACYEGNLIGTLNLVPPALEGSDKYVHFDIAGHYPGHRYSLYQAHVKPLRVANVSADGVVTYVKGGKGKALAGYNDAIYDMTSFSGILDGSAVGKAVDYQFSVNDETESVLYTRDAGTKTLSASKYIGLGDITDELVWNANEYVYMGFDNEAGEKICWAKANLGASSGSEETEDGRYYTWMRTTGRYYPDWNSYSYSGSSYESDTNIGDPATAALGGLWRLPTGDEITALFWNNHASGYHDKNKKYVRYTSHYNGKTIFFRLPGIIGGDGQENRTGYDLEGYYWTSSFSLNSWEADMPRCFKMIYAPSGSGQTSCSAMEPWKGASIRPVFSVESLEEGTAGGGGDEAEPAIRLGKSALEVTSWVRTTHSIPYTILNPKEGPTMAALASVDWIDELKVTPTEIQFEVGSNIKPARTGKITLTYLGAKKEITISQIGSGEPFTVIHVDNLNRSVSNEAGSYKIEYSVDNPIEGYPTKVSSSEKEWCTARLENGYAIFTVLENTSTSERKCTVSVTNQAAKAARILVTQAGKPAAPPELIINLNPDANNNVNADGEEAYGFYARVDNPIAGVDLEMTSDVAWMTNFRHTDDPAVQCFTVSRNTTGRTRYGHVTLQYASIKKQIKFMQQPLSGAITLNPGDLKFDYQARSVSFNVNLPEGYNYDNLNVSLGGEYGPFIKNLRRSGGKVSFDLGENNSTEERSGDIIVQYGDEQKSFRVTQTYEAPIFIISPGSLTLNYKAQKQTIDIQVINPRTTSDLSVVKEGDVSWIWSSAPNGIPTINVSQNLTGATRSGTVQIRYSDPRLGFVRLPITQTTNSTSISIEPEVLNIDSGASTQTLYLTIVDPIQGLDITTTTTADEWIQIIPVSNLQVKAQFSKNLRSRARSASITVHYGDLSCVVPVRQAANPVSDGFVDLGLPSGTLWAEYNLGAATEYDPGTYFAWGETASKAKYTWDNYAWGKKNALTKYTSSDGLTSLQTTDDPATKANFAWSTPTKAQFEELLNQCDCEWVTLPVEGLKVRSRVGDTNIFLPITGYRSDDLQDDPVGYYWSKDVNTASRFQAHILMFLESGTQTDKMERSFGLPVRPVKQP